MSSARLEPVTAHRLTDLVEERLRAHIRAAGLRPGDPLPGEQALAGELGVSRPVVREALSRLRMLGLVRSRRRRGMVIGEPDPFAGLERSLDGALVTARQLEEFADLRLALETGIAEPLFERLQLADLVQLEAIVQDELADPFDPAVLERCDRAFHACLYRVTGNRLLQNLQSRLAHFFDTRWYAREHEHRRRHTAPVGHEDLLDILRAGNPGQYRQAIRDHLAPYRHLVEDSAS